MLHGRGGAAESSAIVGQPDVGHGRNSFVRIRAKHRRRSSSVRAGRAPRHSPGRGLDVLLTHAPLHLFHPQRDCRLHAERAARRHDAREQAHAEHDRARGASEHRERPARVRSPSREIPCCFARRGRRSDDRRAGEDAESHLEQRTPEDRRRRRAAGSRPAPRGRRSHACAAPRGTTAPRRSRRATAAGPPRSSRSYIAQPQPDDPENARS